jgi:hypothetical protein
MAVWTMMVAARGGAAVRANGPAAQPTSSRIHASTSPTLRGQRGRQILGAVLVILASTAPTWTASDVMRAQRGT